MTIKQVPEGLENSTAGTATTGTPAAASPTGTPATGTTATTAGYASTGNADLDRARDNAISARQKANEAAVGALEANNGKIKEQAMLARKASQANARLTAMGNNERLAALGLGGNAYYMPTSGVSETSRIRQDVGFQNSVNNVNRDENNAYNDIMTQVTQAKAMGASELAQLESDWGKYGAEWTRDDKRYEIEKARADKALALQEGELMGSYGEKRTLAGLQYDTDNQHWQSQFDTDNNHWTADYGYREGQDKQAQQNWQNQFDYGKEQDGIVNGYTQAGLTGDLNGEKTLAQRQSEIDQKNWDKQFGYDQGQDTLAQDDWQKDFDYRRAWAMIQAGSSTDSIAKVLGITKEQVDALR